MAQPEDPPTFATTGDPVVAFSDLATQHETTSGEEGGSISSARSLGDVVDDSPPTDVDQSGLELGSDRPVHPEQKQESIPKSSSTVSGFITPEQIQRELQKHIILIKNKSRTISDTEPKHRVSLFSPKYGAIALISVPPLIVLLLFFLASLPTPGQTSEPVPLPLFPMSALVLAIGAGVCLWWIKRPRKEKESTTDIAGRASIEFKLKRVGTVFRHEGCQRMIPVIGSGFITPEQIQRELQKHMVLYHGDWLRRPERPGNSGLKAI